jgi:hypothetical protein
MRLKDHRLNNDSVKKKLTAKEHPEPAHRVRLPGFLIDEEIGLGEAIKRVTYAMGIQPCGACQKRAAGLNNWITFTR